MVIPVTLLNRLKALESCYDVRNDIKVFRYYPEENPPYWEPEPPEPPESWQQVHPRGHTIILQMRDCGIKASKH